MIYAAIFASGRGTRMGGTLPKQFLEYDGIPIIIRSISAFVSSGLCDRIIVAVPEDYTDYTKNLIFEYFEKPGDIEIISGGSSRNQTMKATLAHIGQASDDDIILTHDGVRPFIDDRIISESIEAAKKFTAATVAIPAVDSIIHSADGKFIGENLVRSEIFYTQTPQTFRLKKLIELTEKTSDEVLEKLTDCASLFSEYGIPVKIVRGSRKNIKITYPEDLK